MGIQQQTFAVVGVLQCFLDSLQVLQFPSKFNCFNEIDTTPRKTWLALLLCSMLTPVCTLHPLKFCRLLRTIHPWLGRPPLADYRRVLVASGSPISSGPDLLDNQIRTSELFRAMFNTLMNAEELQSISFHITNHNTTFAY